jgi:hypothetical protein
VKQVPAAPQAQLTQTASDDVPIEEDAAVSTASMASDKTFVMMMVFNPLTRSPQTMFTGHQVVDPLSLSAELSSRGITPDQPGLYVIVAELGWITPREETALRKLFAAPNRTLRIEYRRRVSRERFGIGTGGIDDVDDG